MSIFVSGWKVMRTAANGRVVPISNRVFTVKAAALELAHLANKSGHSGAFVTEVLRSESTTAKSGRSR